VFVSARVATPKSSANERGEGLALAIDDDARPPAHATASGWRAARILAVGLGLWVLPVAGLVAWMGTENLFVHEYRFFTTAALVTFGGAYAVLAYVTQAAVGDFGWVTQAQAMDGLALAETTPGPLIMVLQFVGFMAGWNHPTEMGRTTTAVMAALVATYTTFLPCFVFVFLGAPYVERLRNHAGLAAALSGVTAAVVGVVASLAVIFGRAVLWPGGPGGGIDEFAALLGALSFLALSRFRVNVVWVVLAGGIAGLARVFLG
jgi:chromate transporter